MKLIRKIAVFIFKALRNSQFILFPIVTTIYCKIYLWLNGAEFSSLQCFGKPHIHLSLNATLEIGRNFYMNNGIVNSGTGNNGKCKIDVSKGAKLTIGDFVGMSDVTILCQNKITIKDNVKLGVGVHIYDSDFHSLNSEFRKNNIKDLLDINTKPINIENNVFIGAHSIVLKGVTIGENSIVGAGSIVTKDIPKNQIWAGNPAKYIKIIDEKSFE